MGVEELRVKLTDGAPLPRHAMQGDAGLDLTVREDVTLMPGETRMVGTGVAMEIPEGYFGLLAPRSGMAAKRGVTLANTPSVIDSGYRGEVMVALRNINPQLIAQTGEPRGGMVENWDGAVTISRGERVCQLIVMRHATVTCVEVEGLSGTARGDGGFGSTGLGEVVS